MSLYSRRLYKPGDRNGTSSVESREVLVCQRISEIGMPEHFWL